MAVHWLLRVEEGGGRGAQRVGNNSARAPLMQRGLVSAFMPRPHSVCVHCVGCRPSASLRGYFGPSTVEGSKQTLYCLWCGCVCAFSTVLLFLWF